MTQDISTIKQEYRELFDVAHQRLLDVFNALQTNFQCPTCPTPPTAIEEPLHPGCGYIEWQKHAILTLDQQIGKEIVDKLNEIDRQREIKGQCHMCGVCCSLASSEFSHDQLKEKAAQGDDFAQQFTSIFLPYTSHEEAHQKFPEIVGEILTQTDGNVHFYHCPHLGPDNKCTIYNDPKRPAICDRYPETPLTLMYKNCGYQPWKQAELPTTLLAHATLELCQHYSHKILDAVKQASA